MEGKVGRVEVEGLEVLKSKEGKLERLRGIWLAVIAKTRKTSNRE
jgi:hypothetical protein